MVSLKYYKFINNNHNTIVKQVINPNVIIDSFFTLCGYCKNARWVSEQDYGYCKIRKNKSGSCYDGIKWFKNYKSDLSTNDVYVHSPEKINCKYFKPNICYCKGIIHYDKYNNLTRYQHTMCKENYLKDLKLPKCAIIFSIISLIVSIWSVLR